MARRTLGKGRYKGAAILGHPVGDGLLIKRVVLYYDPNLKEEEIQGHDAQYRGVQLLRGRQWIETQDVRDEVPSEFREGFGDLPSSTAGSKRN